MFDYDLFRVNLILTRKALSMTQETLANSANISEKNLSKIESGNQLPNLPTIISILNVFNTSVAEFMEQKDDSKNILINKANDYLSTLSDNEKTFIMKFLRNIDEDWFYEYW